MECCMCLSVLSLSWQDKKKQKEKPSKDLVSPPLPNHDEGWGGVDISTTLITPSSPKGLALRVYGEWSKDCKTCPKVYQNETIQFQLRVLLLRLLLLLLLLLLVLLLLLLLLLQLLLLATTFLAGMAGGGACSSRRE